jgi:hypothetical protein
MSYIQESAEKVAKILGARNLEYAPTTEFSNFEAAATVAGIGPLQVMTAQAAIKLTRIQALMWESEAHPEALKDSFLDLAGYATIAHAWLTEQAEQSKFKAEQEMLKASGHKDPFGSTGA